jgi:molybdopterin-binding protein
MALLTARDAAQRLGVGYSTLKQWIYNGRVRTTTTEGGHHRIADSEVDRLLARSAAPPSPERASSPATGLIVALSGRNRLRGYVEEVRVDGLIGQVRLRIGDQRLTAVITSDAIDELKLRRGDRAVAIIKSTEVMVALEAELPAPPSRRRRASSHTKSGGAAGRAKDRKA